jgi:hypothetical protein
VKNDMALHHNRQFTPGYEPLYGSTLSSIERGGGFTESSSLYNGSEWVATAYLLRNGSYALVYRVRDPKSGLLNAQTGTRETIRAALRVISQGAVCTGESQCPGSGKEFYPDENQWMPCDTCGGDCK